MANKKITLHEFIEKYVARNTLCRLWKPLKTGNKMMILKEPIMEWEILQIPIFKECEFIQITDILCDSHVEAINLVIKTDYNESYISSVVEMYRYNRYKMKENQSDDLKPINVIVCSSLQTINKFGNEIITSSIKNIIGENVSIYMPQSNLERDTAYLNYVKRISESDIVVVLLKEDGSIGDSTAYEVAIAKFFEKTILHIDMNEFLNKKGE